ncbi:hypothetical protein OS493_000552 [Desmophyllum pertusum]|uniref:Uncharacterized protein n=1 Tax=Desmophyllum pertusum TaxID=174260 RepID=A0A9X0A788_9CNID|nr:hypothetical protein OS493_000552 [Desmophyllum pertusum]
MMENETGKYNFCTGPGVFIRKARHRSWAKILTYAFVYELKDSSKDITGVEDSVMVSIHLKCRKCSLFCSKYKMTSVKSLLLYGAISHTFPISYVIDCQNDR